MIPHVPDKSIGFLTYWYQYLARCSNGMYKKILKRLNPKSNKNLLNKTANDLSVYLRDEFTKLIKFLFWISKKKLKMDIALIHSIE